MERTLTNIATQLVQRHESKRRPVRAIIKHVNYANRHIQVTRNGAYIRHCKVQRGISLGTVNAPIVRVGDVALIERDPVTQKWLCVEIRSKVRCATGNAPASEIEADTGAEVSYTATTQQWSQGITSDFLFDPPVIPLGQLTLPEQQQELICGLPRCTNCAPDGFQSGMALVISSDAEHPSGCWKWGFRLGGCGGSPALQATYQYDTTLFGGAALNIINVNMVVNGTTAYVAIYDNGNTYGKLHVIDASDITNPVVVGTANIPFSATLETICRVQYYAGNCYVTVRRGGTTLATTYSHTHIFDVTTPSSPTLSTTIAWTGMAWGAEQTPKGGPEVVVISGVIYLVGLIRDRNTGSLIVGWRIVDITNPASPTTVATVVRPGAEIWIEQAVSSNGFLFLASEISVGIDQDIYIYDFTTPASPTLAAIATASGNTKHLALNPELTRLYSANASNSKFDVFDISTITSPALLSSTTVSTNPRSCDICGDYLFVALIDGSVEAYDVSDGSSPALSGSDAISDYDPFYLQVENQKIYLNGRRNSSPRYPTLATMLTA